VAVQVCDLSCSSVLYRTVYYSVCTSKVRNMCHTHKLSQFKHSTLSLFNLKPSLPSDNAPSKLTSRETTIFTVPKHNI
jgi:hypothetical protein